MNPHLLRFYLPAKDEGEQWAALGGFWSNLPVKQLDRFYTKQKDHYSFDNSRLSFGYDYDYRIPRQRYVDVLDSIITGTYYYSINKRWGGSCFGMASTTLTTEYRKTKTEAMGVISSS